MENKEITISMQEYKELLIIKGKYEELKSQQTVITTYPLKIDFLEEQKISKSPYNII